MISERVSSESGRSSSARVSAIQTKMVRHRRGGNDSRKREGDREGERETETGEKEKEKGGGSETERGGERGPFDREIERVRQIEITRKRENEKKR